MNVPQPGPAHTALAALVGIWTGDERLTASPWSPATTAVATMEFRGALAGFAVLQDYRHRRADGQELSGHGVFTADPGSGETLWYHFDSYGWPPEGPARGGWDGDTLTLVKTTARGTARHVFTLDGERLTYVIDVCMGGEAERRGERRAALAPFVPVRAAGLRRQPAVQRAVGAPGAARLGAGPVALALGAGIRPAERAHDDGGGLRLAHTQLRQRPTGSGHVAADPEPACEIGPGTAGWRAGWSSGKRKCVPSAPPGPRKLNQARQPASGTRE
jgi:Protein of unknown function (DUF1579)